VIEIFVVRTDKKRTAKLGNKHELAIKLIMMHNKPETPEKTGVNTLESAIKPTELPLQRQLLSI
jgi:hypothetical protein